jgi:lactate racemase
MRIMMRYGRKGLALDLPDELKVTVIKKRKMPVLKDPEGEVLYALRHPVGSKSLAEEAGGCKKVCILICDITRPVPNGIILPVLVRELMDAGVPPDAITLLVATGLHRPNEGEELREVVGSDWVLNSVCVGNHFARNDEDHILLGTTPSGVPVRLDRRFVEADLRIAVGLVEPHFMAGYSGGRKVIVPGVSHHETIRALHSTRMLNHEKVANCLLEGNPVHETQIAAVGMVGKCLAVNTVIDEERRLSFVDFGVIEESHLAAVAFARPYFEIQVGRRFRTVVTSSAGYPLDRNYYQTVKGMVGVADIVEPGGNLFVASECAEGLGTVEYADSQSRLIRLGMDRFLVDSSGREFASVDEWESVMQIKAMKAGTVHLYSGCLSDEERVLTGVRHVEDLARAVLASVRDQGDPNVAVVPEGPYVIPAYTPESRIG